ncbi:hypothetical protein MXB_3043 [Myxobolus squamalis]|nr:hypothetical protein MXB_3043 [Myxobolus squamalis]
MKSIKKRCWEIFDTVLDLMDRTGDSIVLAIDRKLNNEPKFCDILNRKIPMFLSCIIENINDNKYEDVEQFGKEILTIVRKQEELEGPNSLNKVYRSKSTQYSSVVKRSIRAKIENIKAEENLTDKKRSHKSSSFYAEDEASDHAISGDSISSRKRTANTSAIKGWPQNYQKLSCIIIYSSNQTHKYRDRNEVTDDFLLMFNNSLNYYPIDSLMYKLALEFIDLINEADCLLNPPLYSRKRKYKKKSIATELRSQRVSTDDENHPNKIVNTKKKSPKKVRQIYMKIIKIKDKSDLRHLISTAFKKAPSIEEYPEYYQIIKNPIDLNMIGENIRSGNYKNAGNFLEDISTLISNAQFFNKKSSQIYKDAVLLENYLMENFSRKISQLVEKKLKSMKVKVEVNSVDRAISKMLSVLFKATDSNKNKLVKLIGIQKTFRELRNNLDQFDSVEELYSKIVSILNENDEFDLLCIDSLSQINFKENFDHLGVMHTRSLNLLSIKDSIVNAFIGNLVLESRHLNLRHNRKFAHNELVLTNNYFCFKVKKISQKLNVLHARRYKRQKIIPVEKLYIFCTLYDSASRVLYPIELKAPENQETEDLLTFRIIERNIDIISKNNIETIPMLESDMFVHMLHKKNVSNIIDEAGNCVQILYRNTLLRQGDFIKIKNSKIDSIYEIRKILPTNRGPGNQQENSHFLSCLIYLTVDSLTCFPFDLFYSNEIFQTDTFIDIDLHQSLNSVRPTQYREDQIFVCRQKLVNNEFSDIGPFTSSILTFPDELKLFSENPKFYQQPGSFFKKELSRILEKDDLIDEKRERLCKATSASVIDRNAIVTDTPQIFECNWLDCTQTFTSNLSLFEHFCTYHAKIIKSESDKQNYMCKWIDCPHSLQLNEFPLYSCLRCHVRDVHCKSLETALLSGVHPSDHDYLTNSAPLVQSNNPLNNPIILSRDAYIDSLIKIIEKKDKDIDLLKHEVDDLKIKLNENTEAFEHLGFSRGQQTHQTVTNGSFVDYSPMHGQTSLYHSPIYRK